MESGESARSQYRQRYAAGLYFHQRRQYKDALAAFDDVINDDTYSNHQQLYAFALCGKADSLFESEGYWDALETYQAVREIYQDRTDNGISHDDRQLLREKTESGLLLMGNSAIQQNLHGLCAETAAELLKSCASDSTQHRAAAQTLHDAALQLTKDSETCDEGLGHLRSLASVDGYKRLAQKAIGLAEEKRGNIAESSKAYQEAFQGGVKEEDAEFVGKNVLGVASQTFDSQDWESASRCYRIVAKYVKGGKSVLREKLEQCGNGLYVQENFQEAVKSYSAADKLLSKGEKMAPESLECWSYALNTLGRPREAALVDKKIGKSSSSKNQTAKHASSSRGGR